MEEILHQLRLVVYPIIYKVLYIPGGAGFLPSTVVLWFRDPSYPTEPNKQIQVKKWEEGQGGELLQAISKGEVPPLFLR